MELGAVFFACDLARLLVLVAFLVLVNPLCLLGLWLGLKVFSLFTNFLSTMGIRCFRFFSVARRNASPNTNDENKNNCPPVRLL